MVCDSCSLNPSLHLPPAIQQAVLACGTPVAFVKAGRADSYVVSMRDGRQQK